MEELWALAEQFVPISIHPQHPQPNKIIFKACQPPKSFISLWSRHEVSQQQQWGLKMPNSPIPEPQQHRARGFVRLQGDGEDAPGIFGPDEAEEQNAAGSITSACLPLCKWENQTDTWALLAQNISIPSHTRSTCRCWWVFCNQLCFVSSYAGMRRKIGQKVPKCLNQPFNWLKL